MSVQGLKCEGLFLIGFRCCAVVWELLREFCPFRDWQP